MCTNQTQLSHCTPSNIAVHTSTRQSLNRRRPLKQGKEKKIELEKTVMEIKNLKLYMQNKSIIEENEKLRKKAFLLHQENRALLSQLQMKFSSPHDRCLSDNTKNSR